MSTVRAFPWATLESVAKRDVLFERDLRRLLELIAPIEDVGRALSELARAPVASRLRRTETVASPPGEGAIAFKLRVASWTLVVELENALAIDLVARSLKRSLPPTSYGARPSDAVAVAGAAAAIAVRALRNHRSDAEVVALDAGPARAVLEAADLADPAAAEYTVMVDAEAYRARILFSRRVAAGLDASTTTAAQARALLARGGALPVSLDLIARAAWVTAAELGTLEPGSVFLPSGWKRPVQNAWNVSLASKNSERGMAATLEADGRLVLGNAPLSFAMSTSEQDTLVGAALDAPVVVRVELGTVEMAASEWVRIAPGDVITVGTRVGGPVVLRAGTTEIARGELVDVEGEIGVRIVSRTAT